MSYINCLQGSAEEPSENELLEMFIFGKKIETMQKNLS